MCLIFSFPTISENNKAFETYKLNYFLYRVEILGTRDEFIYLPANEKVSFKKSGIKNLIQQGDERIR